MQCRRQVGSLVENEDRGGHGPVGVPHPQEAREGARELAGTVESVAFENVVFGYKADNPVIRDVSFSVDKGQSVALVGHTGAGKSSIANLLTRFYEYQGGNILIDGRDVRSLNLGQYRQQIGLVPQAPFLFSGTVRDNIRYGKPDADDDAVRAAAMQIGQGEWLDALSDGLDSDVGERGPALDTDRARPCGTARRGLADRIRLR